MSTKFVQDENSVLVWADGETYVTRYGDTVNAITHEVVSWSPFDVQSGIYGDDTREWVASMCERHGIDMPCGFDAEWSYDHDWMLDRD